MKQFLIFTFFISFCVLGSYAQNDTLYIMKGGEIIDKFNVGTQIDSIIFYAPAVQPEESDDTFTDPRDGNVYQIVKIGDQVWMAENLRYLPGVVGPAVKSATEPYYYVYGYNGTDVSSAKATNEYLTYGVIYNWNAANAACPPGWHLATHSEWTQLTNFLGGAANAGGKLKEAGTAHWQAPNTAANNESGFTAIPGGFFKQDTGEFLYIGQYGYWWTATDGDNNETAWRRYMLYNNKAVNQDTPSKAFGYYVRCVKD